MWYNVTICGRELRALQKALGEKYNVENVRISSSCSSVEPYVSIEYDNNVKRSTYDHAYYIACGKRKGYKKGHKMTCEYYQEGQDSISGFGVSMWNYRNRQEKPLESLDLALIEELKQYIEVRN